MSAAPSQKFTVLVNDNYHYQDEEERYQLGEFDTLPAAISACQYLVDEYLDEARKDLTSSMAPVDDLYRSYTMFGPDPFVVGAVEHVPFSAWTYAKQRCHDIFSGQLPPIRSEPSSQ